MLKQDIIYLTLQVLSCVLLFLLAGFSQKYVSSKWKLCYLAPAVFCIVYISTTSIEKLLLPVYIGAAAVAVGFFWEKKLLRRIVSALCAFITVGGLIGAAVNPYFRMTDYLGEFEDTLKEMEKRYILTDYKQIDWDELHDKYEPIFREATESADEKLNCSAWMQLCAEFKDGHVNYIPEDEAVEEEVIRDICGRDFGLSILNYEDGRAVAVNVDPSLNELGIHDGTVIVTWNGKSPEDAAKDSEAYQYLGYADEYNAYFYRSLLAAGTGKKGNVVYIDDDGNEMSAELSSIGKYYDRYSSTLEKLNKGVKSAHMSVTELNDTTVCLRIKAMMYVGEDSVNTDYESTIRSLRHSIKEYRGEGKENLVIDLRGNGGGSGTLVRAIAGLLAPEGEHLYCYDGVWDREASGYKKNPDGTFVVGKKNTFEGENCLGGGKIVILVDRGSASASDHMAAVMSRFDNVTVMGFTKSCGSAQGVTGIAMSSGGVSLSGSLTLNEDGTVWIDAGTDMKSGSPLDIRVPLDEDAVKAIFVDDTDYLLEKALEHLDSDK